MTSLRPLVALGVISFATAPLSGQAEYTLQIESQVERLTEGLATEGYVPSHELMTGATSASETSRFEVDLNAGVVYRIVGVCDNDCSDVDLAMYDPSGTSVAEDLLPDDVPVLRFTPTVSGTFEIVVSMVTCGAEPCYWGVKSYADRQASATIVTGGTGIRRESGSLSRGDVTLSDGEYIDEYTFRGSAGEEVIIDLHAPDFDPYLMVIGPNDVKENNDDYEGDAHRSLVRFELPSSGEYTIGVTSYAAGETGSYDLSIVTDAGAMAAAGPLVERGTLASGDAMLSTGEYVDEYSFVGNPGERVSVDLRGDFDTYLMLLGPGDFRQENDDADDVGHSAIEADLTAAGTYRVLVTSYAPDQIGSYDLTVERGAVVASGDQRDVQTLTVGGVAAGTLEPGDGELETGEYRDLWVVDGRAGQTLTVEISSSDFDTYLMLVSPDGDVVDENDDTDGGTDSRISVRLPSTGRYRVVATTYRAGDVGGYSLRANAASASASAPTPRTSSGGGQVYGVFVGVSDYGGRASDLAYTADDARRAAEALVKGAGMSAANAIVLTDGDATVANMRAAFQEMGNRVGPDDTFVYFYSGHGARAPRAAAEQADPDALDETIELFDAEIRDNDFSDMLGLIHSGLSLVVLDACFSGGFSKDVISVPGRMGLFSSEEDVTSQVAAKFRAGGYLAQFLFDAVGDGLADENRDGAISAIELSQYLHERYRNDVKSAGPDDYVRTGGPRTGFQHLVVDRGSIGPDRVVFR